MSGLAHYIEAEGVATATIALVREHAERIRPPRALWVPFEFGRPLGAPGDPEFQLDVLHSLLRLFERDEGPVLEDYPRDAPAVEVDATGWACPVALPAPETEDGDGGRLRERLAGEVERLRPWYDEARRERTRTSVGVSGLDVDGLGEAAGALARFAAGEPFDPPAGASEPMPALLRFLADDLKAYYFEAVTARSGERSATSTDLGRWLFTETVLGDVLFRVRDRLAQSEDPQQQRLRGVIVPAVFARLRGD